MSYCVLCTVYCVLMSYWVLWSAQARVAQKLLPITITTSYQLRSALTRFRLSQIDNLSQVALSFTVMTVIAVIAVLTSF